MDALSYCQLMERCLAAEARVVEAQQRIAAQREYYEGVIAAQREYCEGVIADDGKRIAELVEVLKKAQTKAIEQGRTSCELFDEVTALRQRIAELEFPATDRIVAGIKADGVDSGIETIIIMPNHQAPGVIDAINVLSVHSFELREGAK